MPTPTRPPHIDDEKFLAHVTDRLAALPAVRAVALGGSRAQGTHGPDSDWDVAIYYRGAFDPDDLRAVGWQGEVSEIGGWGGGVFNGGAWLTVEGRRVDVHYRDLDVVERELAGAEQGRFHVEPLLFHLAGIPSYLLVAELAVNRVLRGDLPRPAVYPARLRISPPTGTARPVPPSPTPRPTTHPPVVSQRSRERWRPPPCRPVTRCWRRVGSG